MRTVLTVVLALLLSGCSGTPARPHAAATSSAAATSPAAGSSGAARPPAAPRNGACYRLSFADATRATSRKHAVPCTRGHSAITIYVGRLHLVVDGHAVGVDSALARRKVSRTCMSELPSYLGGSRQAQQLSRFQVVWFSPTLRQADAGAAWFRCDLVALGAGEQLMRLPRSHTLRHVLDRPRALDTFGLCGTAQPGAAGFRRVPCADHHSWVAVSTIALPGGSRYPGVPAVRQAGDQTCAGVVRQRDGLALQFRYGWEWPTAAQWAAGQHYGYCWAPAF